MNEIVIKHVKVSELPASWRTNLDAPGDARVTVRIETEAPSAPSGPAEEESAFGMWRDRPDIEDVEGPSSAQDIRQCRRASCLDS